MLSIKTRINRFIYTCADRNEWITPVGKEKLIKDNGEQKRGKVFGQLIRQFSVVYRSFSWKHYKREDRNDVLWVSTH